MKNRKSLFAVWLLLIAILTLSACNNESAIETPNARVCVHEWKSGVCELCGEECAHEVFESGRCTVCNIRCPHKSHDPQTLLCDDCGREVSHTYTYENYINGTCTMCGQTTMFVWELGGVDETLKIACEKQGTIETISYTTHAYAIEASTGQMELLLEKTMNVYLPYGYSEDQQYDVLYLMHGGGENQGYWFGVGDYSPDMFQKYQATNCVKNILDNMIDKGLCKPLIVVTPTFYSEVEGYESYEMDFPAYFGKELKESIMPLIAERYATYAQGTNAEALVAARDHQAYAGFSMGSMTSFQSVMTYCTDYISYIGSYSAGYSPDSEAIKAGVDSVVDALNGEYKDYKINYWFNANGTMDSAHDGHVETYQQLTERLPERFVEGETCMFIDLPGGAHTYPSWEIDLYNTLLLFFK